MGRRGVAWLLTGLVSSLLLAPALRAQDVSGALRGRVQGPDSQSLARVEVEASGPALPRPVTVETDAQGRFQLLSLPVGTYAVRLRAVGYRPVRYLGVTVGLGRTADLGSIVLQTLTVELPEITVEARPTPVDPTTTTVGATIPATAFDALPLDRSFRSVVALVPQATYQPPNLGGDGAGSEGVNIAGGTVWDNAYYVDGMDVTDPLNGTTGTNLPYNFLQAVEVKTGGYEAEYGRALGGVINMVTPSGSNRFEGEAFSFLSDHRFTTAARYGRNQPNLDSYTQFEVGLALSGPIRRDRAWFYMAYSPIISGRTAFFRGMAPARDRLTQHRFAGKITWQPGPATRLVLSGIGDPGVHDAVQAGDFGAPDSVLNPEPVLGTWRRGGESLSLRGSQLIRSRLLLEAVALRSWFRSDRLPQSPLGGGPVLLDYSSDPNSVIGSGGFGGSDRVDLDRTSFQLRGTIGAGPHTLKAGAEYQLNTLHERLEEGGSTGGGIWRYGNAFYLWDRLVSDGSVANRVYTLFAQDSWEATGWLRLNAGLRWEEQNWLDSRRATRQVIP
ncbi:MAG TPA: TonB-dependent receptor, partial [Gemmatimonadales bacterium]|nr:TonB-dependent receptor [Gemmatimonadales bacterium]